MQKCGKSKIGTVADCYLCYFLEANRNCNAKNGLGNAISVSGSHNTGVWGLRPELQLNSSSELYECLQLN